MTDSPSQVKPDDGANDGGEFVRVRFAGGRFDSHTIPFDTLPDLAAYRDLIVEVAKHLFFERNQGRKRVPKGYTESFQLGLAGVISGNSATALAHRLVVRDLAATQPDLALDMPLHHEFEAARDLVDLVIARAALNQGLPSGFPAGLAMRFNRFGQGLRSGEFLELSHQNTTPVRYDSSTRKRIVLSVNPTYDDIVDDKFILDGGKVHKNIVHLIDKSGSTLDLYVNSEDELEKAIARRRHAVRIVGIGQYNKEDHLTKILSYNELIHTDDEPQQDFEARLDEISRTPSGWYSSGNPSPVAAAVERMRRFISTAVPEAAIPYPYIYPMPDGGVRAEWTRGDWEVSATFDASSLLLTMHALNFESDEELEVEIDSETPEMLSKFMSFWSRVESGSERT